MGRFHNIVNMGRILYVYRTEANPAINDDPTTGFGVWFNCHHTSPQEKRVSFNPSYIFCRTLHMHLPISVLSQVHPQCLANIYGQDDPNGGLALMHVPTTQAPEDNAL